MDVFVILQFPKCFFDDPCTLSRVFFHDFIFLIRQLAGFLQDIVRYCDFSDIMKLCCGRDHLRIVISDAVCVFGAVLHGMCQNFDKVTCILDM